MTETLNQERITSKVYTETREEFIERNAPSENIYQLEIARLARRASLAAEAKKGADKSLSQIDEFTD